MMKFSLSVVAGVLLAGVLLQGGAARAQEVTDQAAAQDASGQDLAQDAPVDELVGPRPPFQDSLLFSPVEVNAIQQAIDGRAVKGAALKERAPADAAARYIKVGGVFYEKENDWVVWLNGQAVTPGNLLPEIVGIEVRGSRIFLEWFDAVTDGVISITLRPNQTYDLVTGVLLPG